MSRMLEALRQIEDKSPERPRGPKPVSAEELEQFGLRQLAPPATEQPRQTHQQVGQDAPDEQTQHVGREHSSPSPRAASRGSDLETASTCVEAETTAAPDSYGSRLAAALAEPNRRQYEEMADNILSPLTATLPAVLMFTSPGDGDGKTDALAPLAVTLAERVTGEVVAVDFSFRHPTLAEHFGIAADCGLADVLGRSTDWRAVVRKTATGRLHVLPGRRFPVGDGRWPEEPTLVKLLEELRGEYRLVLLDAASLGHPEVAPMSRFCDGTYLIVRLGHTPRRAVRQAIRVIERCGGRVLGCVLTNAPGDD